MNRRMLKSKIHGATVTQANLHYVGSVTVDLNLLEAADILPGELVAIVDVTNGARLETYVIAGQRGSGVLGINGAAAHLVHTGDTVVLPTYAEITTAEARAYMPAVVHVNYRNAIIRVTTDPSAPVSGGKVTAPSARSVVDEPRALAWCGPIPD